MPSQAQLKRHTLEERRRVLEAHRAGEDWRAVARHNGFARSTAEYLVAHGRLENLPRGGAWSKKVTPDMKAALESYVDECCSYTLATVKSLMYEDFRVDISETTISRHLVDMLYTVKQTHVEPTTCNNPVNKENRRVFAEKLLYHQDEGDLVVYFDETNYNLYTKRTRGRAKKGKRAIDKLPPLKGANLQLQCAVSSAYGVVAYRAQRGSIKMQTNADFVDELYAVIKSSDVYKDEFVTKNIVIVFDNAPAHSQTEELVTAHDDLVLLRLGSYSPMCNPIENCFSSLKANIKQYLALARDEMNNPQLTADGQPISKTEARMQLLERAARVCMQRIPQRMVQKMELHAAKFVNAAARGEDMQYGA